VGIALLVAAGALALVYGSNAGATIAATSLRVHDARPWLAVVALGLAIAVAPAVLGTAVATTVAHELVPSGGDPATDRAVFLAGVVAALAVTGALSRWGQPTSLTLALIAGIAGGGLGAGQAVAWTAIGRVLALVAVAPFLGVALAALITRASRRWHVSPGGVRRWHLGSYAGLCLAFGANDAQKLLAVVAVAIAPGAARVDAVWWQLVLCAGLFSVGTAVGLGRMERTVNRGILAVRGLDSVITQTTTAAVMLASSGVGSPVGMAQTLSGSLVGAGLARGRGKIRWEYAAKVALAWVLTVPAAVAVATGVAWLTSGLAAG
jgi:PiT family inorganic phosphate transporter